MTVKETLQEWAWSVRDWPINWRVYFSFLAILLVVILIMVYAYVVALANAL